MDYKKSLRDVKKKLLSVVMGAWGQVNNIYAKLFMPILYCSDLKSLKL